MLAESTNRASAGLQEKRLVFRTIAQLSLRCHLITMVQPAESRKGLNLAVAHRATFCSTTCWRVLRRSKMRPVLMVIVQVGRHQPFEMPLIDDDHVVQQVASAGRKTNVEISLDSQYRYNPLHSDLDERSRPRLDGLSDRMAVTGFTRPAA